ncbi:MAG TPA: cell envelope integrity protein TolA [Thiotrichaceae bacterium]|nr:cell envelope integrity protein TolA [Thiotrichaceae bacterium]
MWDNIISFIDAIIIHALLLAIVFFSIDLPDESLLTSSAPENTIQAVALDEQQVLAAISRWKSEQVIENKALRAQQQTLEQKKRDIQKTVLKETQSLEQLQKQKDAEQQRLADIEQQLLETLALEELKYEKAQEEARLAREAEAKRQAAELARLTQETEEQAEEEEARLASEPKIQAIEQAPLADEQLETKRQTTAATRQSQSKKRLQKVTLQLQKKIRQHWIRPRYGYYTGLSCVIEIRLKPGGVINEVNIIKSSGNLVFDHSAISAIHEASPLRIPHDLFEAFQHFYFTFKP